MTSREMHYDLKQKLNKIDSQKYRNLVVPVIDWKLNEAQEILVKMIAQPRYTVDIGFEIGRRNIDDIRTIVVDQKEEEYTEPEKFDKTSFVYTLPSDYWYLAKLNIVASKGECKDVLLYDSKDVQHDDLSESSMFEKSSFEWRVSNYRFNSKGIRMFTDGTFTIDKVGIEYLRRPDRIYNAQDWLGGKYEGLDGQLYEGFQNCTLPDTIHGDIVDLAVMIIAGDLNLPNYQQKQNKLKLNYN